MTIDYKDIGRKNNSLRIAIIGVDGCGKSSCFKGALDVLSDVKLGGIGDKVFISEGGNLTKPKIRFTRLKTFLGKRAKNVKNRMLYKMLKFSEVVLRVKLHNKIESKYKPELILTDGVPLINTIGWGVFYYPDIFNESTCRDVIKYMTGIKIPWSQKGFFLKRSPEILLVNIFGIKFQRPDIVFFLKVTPDIAVKRVSERGKKLQVHETKGSLDKLQEAYELVCKILSEDTEIIKIETDDKTINQVNDIIIEKIRCIL